ncbi:AsnC family transcriptional regulator [Mesorhizobium sp. L2C066B000]|nr:AsnC family transcriptional regulator [Mesorhizobium sp. L2C066B000]
MLLRIAACLAKGSVELYETYPVFGDTTTRFVEMLSEPEQRLLSLLRANARASTAELARQLGVSRTTVQSRIERLEQRGIITGYGVRMAPDYEQGLVRAHVLLTVTPKLADKVVRALQALPPVRTLHSVSGNFDMTVIVDAPSIRDLDALLDEIGAMDGVERTSSSIILSTRIDR